ncbi:MAG: GHKL domain-containing protein [Coriobacteriia bacterium]|nr:GHKL domain-containing protein [Coriobacteriia bacterium]
MNKDLRRRLSRITGGIYAFVAIVLMAVLIGQVIAHKNNIVYHYSGLRVITEVECLINGEAQKALELPARLEGLKPGDVVNLERTIETRILDNVLIKGEHLFLKFYVNGRLYYEIGSLGTYPSFQKEPPHVVTSIPLPSTPDYLNLRFSYVVPEGKSSLVLPEMYIGENELLFTLLMDYNLALLLISIFMIIGAAVFIIIGLTAIRRALVASAFLWLGLTCLSTATWTLCSNEIVLYLIPHPSLLYNLGYLGMFGIIPAFLRFNYSMLYSKQNWLVRGLSYASAAAFILALTLHLTGVLSFAEMAPMLLVIGAIILASLLVALVIEQYRYKTPVRMRFVISCSIFTLFTTLEMVNWLGPHFAPTGLFFQLGLAFFVIELGVLAWEYVREALDASEKNARLQVEIASTNRALGAQRALYKTLTTSNEEVRKLRHDMRHQLSVIRGYLEDKKNKKALEYLDSLYGTIPNTADLFVCDNFAVNALVGHYQAIAKEQGIQVDLKLVVPEKVGRVLDTDLCVIIGNLFENAIEACAYVDEHKRFIKIQSSTDSVRFTFVIDNSFDGHVDVRHGEFYSRKRAGKGIGMASVRAEVQKYDGSMKYETVDGVFKTSLYVKL